MPERSDRARSLRGSLKGQIRVLGLLVFASVVLAAIVAVALIRSSSSLQIGSVSRNLEGEIREIVQSYGRLQRAGLDKNGLTPIGASDEAALNGVMTSSLSDDTGMQGGFFDAAHGRLVGFAFPTARPPLPARPVEGAERAADRVSRLAVARGSSARLTLPAGPDLQLYRARAILNGGTVEGAVWVMQTVPGVRALRSRFYRIGFLALLVLSLGTTIVAWRLTHRLDGAIRTVEAALSQKESRPESAMPKTRVEEIDRIGEGIDHLARSLEEHRRQQEALENRLHRADRLAALGRLVAGVAHEVRNPLASIKLKLHLLRRHRAGDAEDAFSVIEEEIGRLDRMVERLLTISKASNAPGSAAQDLARIVESRAQFWSGRAAEKGVRLALDIRSEARGAAAVDPDAVVSILDNLLANAIEAVDHGGGTIELLLERSPDSELTLAVTDTGPGVDPSAIERLFEPFFTTRDGGTGLGLFLSAEMARRLGGEIRYVPRREAGARFELRVKC